MINEVVCFYRYDSFLLITDLLGQTGRKAEAGAPEVGAGGVFRTEAVPSRNLDARHAELNNYLIKYFYPWHVS
jgi:hypothetical protein